MKEFKKIIEVYSTIDFSQRKAALATVVKVEGSSYRRPGARMLMTDDGRWEGAISGGCLEGDALRKARQAILNEAPMLVTYDTMDDKGATSLGVGLGCNGIIHVLIEPINPDEPSNPIELLKHYVHQKEASVLATVFDAQGETPIKIGDRLSLVNALGEANTNSSKRLLELAAKDIATCYASGKSQAKTYELPQGSIDVFLEVIHPEIHLVIFGGGYDAIPVTRLAKELGWHVTVTDDCVAHLAPKRFPAADEVVHASRHSILETIAITPRTAAVLMSHNYKYDLAVMEHLLGTNISYIGMLGPRKRFEKMQEEWQNQGKNMDLNQIERVHSPIGLDIGAETPDEIALSITAEIQAHFTNKPGKSLKKKQGPIHERENTHPVPQI